jgi:alkylation response protein AidB-like acyl-CoA dehydrogenase
MPTATATAQASAKKSNGQRKPLPAPNSEFFGFAESPPAEELAIVKKVRSYMETKVQPTINKYWVEDSFPFELLPSFKELNIAGLGIHGYGCAGGSPLLVGLVAMNIARIDTSLATFWGVHTGLAMITIYLVGTEDQKQKWLPPVGWVADTTGLNSLRSVLS